MRSIQMILICLSALGFVLAVITSLAGGPIVFGVTAEGFSFGSADLALIAIALSLYGKSKE
jgi:hypothetical protein